MRKKLQFLMLAILLTSGMLWLTNVRYGGRGRQSARPQLCFIIGVSGALFYFLKRAEEK
jgi:hypothetical protein